MERRLLAMMFVYSFLNFATSQHSIDYPINVTEYHEPGPLYRVSVNQEIVLITIHSSSRTAASVLQEYIRYDMTGAIDVIKRIDRDDIARQIQSSYVPLQITISFLLENTTLYNVIMDFVDANDNAPEFDSPTQYVEMRERDRISSVVLALARDDDEGTNSVAMYSLVDDNDGLFVLRTRRNTQGAIVELRLETTEQLDYETTTRYTLHLRATEGALNPNSTTQTLNITVIDDCDIPPSFPTTRFGPFTVLENAPIGRQVTSNISAYDPDLVDIRNGLTYHIDQICRRRESTSPHCVRMNVNDYPFSLLDSEQGILILSREVDREEFASYEISLHANDNCSLSTSATVEVEIVDINDNCPEISFSSSVISNVIRESIRNLPITVGFVTVTDRDSGRNGQVNVELYEVIGDQLNSSTTFQLVGQELHLVREVDREVQSEYVLLIVATDNGTSPCSKNRTESLTVQDFNDNPPVIVRDNIQTVYIESEDTTRNTGITTISATDADDYDSGNGRVTFHLPDSDATFPFQHLFRVQETTGVLFVDGVLDFEANPNLFVLVVASDNPMAISGRRDPVLNDSVIINITLTDVNDNRPVIHSPTGVFSVREDFTPATRLFTIDASDLDRTPAFSTLTYSLTSPGSPFTVRTDTGEVFLTEAGLDFETTEQYTVTIGVSDGVVPVTQEVLTISVINVNDEPPEFDLSSRSVSVNIEEHNQLTGVHVVTINATDPDGDLMLDDLRIRIESGNDDNHFEINEETGRITNRVPLDKETVSNYTLIIRANDGVQDSREYATVIINILDINDHPPMFDNEQYRFRVTEGLSGGSPLQGTPEILATDRDTGENERITYSIIGASPQVATTWFTIDPGTGVITTNTELDREHSALPDDGEVLLTVRASNPPINGANPLTTEVEVTVKIVDINDNPPLFSEQNITITLSENYTIGRPFYTVQATDRDQPPNNEITYEIVETSPGLITIDSMSGVLSLSSSLDHETAVTVVFRVRAFDTHMPHKQAYQTIVINVTDSLDPCLALEDFQTTVSLVENSPPDTTVLTFEAVRINGDSVSTIQYDLTNSDGTPSREFAVIKDPVNLQATVRTIAMNIDRENPRAVYTLTITAHDSADSSHECERLISELTVTILDVNDNPPVFESDAYEFSIRETEPAGTPVNSVRATDSDEGVNSEITYSIVERNFPFAISTSGEIRATEELDRDPPSGQAQYVLHVEARDNGVEPRSSSATVTINVEDVNDNDPMFDRNQNLTFRVREDFEVGAVFATILVTDNDDGTNGQVTVRVSLLDPHFELRPNGEIVLVAPLDREDEQDYSFEVRAVDGGNRRATEIVNIVVLDVNDNAPIFRLEPINIPPIKENHPPGLENYFAQVMADDADTGDNAKILYTLEDNTYTKTFSIESETGKVYVSSPSNQICNNPPHAVPVTTLDYERQDFYELTILAYDRTFPRHFASKTIQVRVENVNEHSPVFDVPMNPVKVAINEVTNNFKTTVLKIKAYDWDFDRLTYSVMEDGVSSVNFRYEDGGIVTSSGIDYSNKQMYEIVLTAQELDTNERNSVSVTIQIHVHNENNHPPIFDVFEYLTAATIPEDVDPGTVVLTVHADDADNSTYDAVSYQIRDGNEGDVFRIDSLTGDLILQSHLDHDSVQRYTLSIVATDTGYPTLTSTALELTITVENVNDEPPIFAAETYQFEYTENSPVGTTVGQVVAMDMDSEPFNRVTYTLQDDSVNGLFEVIPSTGEVKSLVVIDKEDASIPSNGYTVRVLATDSGIPALTDTTQVQISIGDVNDNKPKFTRHQYYFYFTQPGESYNLAVEVSDDDSGENAVLVFEIVEQISGDLLQVTSTGSVMLSAPPAANAQIYEAKVRVYNPPNPSDPSLSDTAYVRVVIERTNDRHPRFEQLNGYNVMVSESLSIGRVIFNASEHTSDPDTGPNGELSYQFQEEYPDFAIDSTQGLVTLARMLDFETQESYSLQLAAVDGAGRTVETILSVSVENENDNDPVFDDISDRLVLSSVPEANIDLFTVHASDNDKGSYGEVEYGLQGTQLPFTIDRKFGVVRSTQRIDVGRSFTLTVTASNSGSSEVSQIRIIVDIQACSQPISFVSVSNPLVISVFEDRPRGLVREFAGIVQPQPTQFSLVYNDAPDGLFTLSKTQGTLFLQDTLDYLTRQSYRLVMEAYTEDTSDLQNVIRCSSYLEININVIDVNNIVPRFVHPTYTVSLSEDDDVGTTVFEARALDDDTGTIGELNYEITSGNTKFEINTMSGIVSIRDILDREAQSSYQLTIRAFDLSRQPNTAEMTLYINVQDVNDYKPRFEPVGNRSINVYEHPYTVGGTALIRLAAKDLDEGPPLRYRIFLEETRLRGAVVSNEHTFDIDLLNGLVSLGDTVQLNYEMADYYLLRAEATDTVATAVTFLEMHVLDINDPPMFLSLPTEAVQVWEQVPEGSYLMTVDGGDADQGVNGVVTYSLGEGWELFGEGTFGIDNHTGVIRVRSPPVAMRNLFTVNAFVHITDQGSPPLTDSAQVTISVVDVNNNKPQFSREQYFFGLSSRASIGSEVGRFNISDADLLENMGVIVGIPGYYLESGMFSVSLESGVRRIKYERGDLQTRNYTFRLEARNPSYNPECAPYNQFSYADVTVDVYSDCPAFEQRSYTIEINEGEPSPQVHAQFEATSAVGRQVQYFFRERDELPFTIDRDSGQLIVSSALDRETEDVYTFYVSAIDSIFQPPTCSVQVTVNVLDINDNDPVFLSHGQYKFSLAENNEVDKLIGRVEARDPDLGENSIVRYMLVEQENFPFTVNSENGGIVARRALNAEDESEYIFEVLAIDSGMVPRTGSVMVNVTVDDVNEFMPTLLPFSPPTVTRDFERGSIIGRVQAEDGDANAQLRFYFANIPPTRYFEIDSVTGEIKLIVGPADSSTTVVKRSVEKRQTDNSAEYFSIPTEVTVSDRGQNVSQEFELTLHKSFMIVDTPTPGGLDSNLMIIVIVVGSVTAVIAVFTLVIIVCMCSRFRRNKMKSVARIKDSVANNEGVELNRYGSRKSQRGSRWSTPDQQQKYTTTTGMYSQGPHTLRHSSGSGSNSSRQSYCNSADDELDSNNGDMLKRSAYNSPGLAKRQPNGGHAVHARSTSDLASSIGTDALGSQQLPHPKAKIDAIYAAHQQLLNNHGSRESIHSNHTFASEGGGEADAEDDIHAVLNKYEFDDDDDDDVTTIPDDSSYMGKDPRLQGSNVNIEIPPVEEDHMPRYAYSSQPTDNEWVPRTTTMDQTISGLHEMAGYSSSQDHPIPSTRYREPSQPPSMYGGASSQGSHISLLRHHGHHPPRGYDVPPHMGQPPPIYNEYEYSYHHHPQEHRQSRSRSHPRSYGSASALQEYGIHPRDYPPPREPCQDHHHHQPRGTHMMFSQELPSAYPYHLPHGQMPTSATPTDGTVTPSRAIEREYDEHGEYMSSSSTSLGSTNLSGTTSSIGASASQRIQHVYQK